MVVELTSMMLLSIVTRLIRSFFDRLSEFQLAVNLNKSEFCHGILTCIGHVVGQGHVKPKFEKEIKQLMTFLYFRIRCSSRVFLVLLVIKKKKKKKKKEKMY